MFKGFTKETSDFLWELSFHNERPWFLEHKEQFERCLNQPVRDLARETAALMEERWPQIDWRVHISRIYRDARRLHGRGPMNDHLWFTIYADREEGGGPAYWFSFTPEGWDGGMGLWPSGNTALERFRAFVRQDPASVEAMVRRLNSQEIFTLHGESYKKHKLETTATLQPWVDKKWLGLSCVQAHSELSLSERLYPFLQDGFDFLLPFYEFFLNLPGL